VQVRHQGAAAMSVPLRPLPEYLDPLKVAEVAAAYGISRRAVQTWLARGQFPGASHTPGGHWRIPRADVIAVGRQLGVWGE
jgi:excisionase family DNA binding protein